MKPPIKLWQRLLLWANIVVCLLVFKDYFAEGKAEVVDVCFLFLKGPDDARTKLEVNVNFSENTVVPQEEAWRLSLT